jgi:REP element-mobilizing transposase RayT
MTKGLKRYYGRGHLHFVTFSCYRRRPLLEAAPAKDLFLSELARARCEYGFALAGYVVMPEHVHLLLSEPRKGTPSTVLSRHLVGRPSQLQPPAAKMAANSFFARSRPPMRFRVHDPLGDKECLFGRK